MKGYIHFQNRRIFHWNLNAIFTSVECTASWMFINNFLVLLVFIYSFKRRSKASTSGVAQTLIAQNTLSDGGMEEEEDAR